MHRVGTGCSYAASTGSAIQATEVNLDGDNNVAARARTAVSSKSTPLVLFANHGDPGSPDGTERESIADLTGRPSTSAPVY